MVLDLREMDGAAGPTDTIAWLKRRGEASGPQPIPEQQALTDLSADGAPGTALGLRTR